MALNFTPQTKKIEFSGGDMTVRGLNFPDLTVLVQTHREAAQELYDRFTGLRKDDAITTDDIGSIAMDLVSTVPAVVAHVIAIAADEPESFDLVTRLPFDVQATALEEIASLTFAMEGGAKGFLETILRISKRTNVLVDEVKNPPS